MRGIPLQTKARELVDFFQTTYNATVRRARIVFKESDDTSMRAHIEFFQVDDASTLSQESNMALGGKGIFFKSKGIWIGPDKFPKGLDFKGDDDTLYYESDRMSSLYNVAMPTNNKSDGFGDDTSNDIALFCLSVYLEEVKAREDAGGSCWIHCSSASMGFLSKMPQTYLKAASQDEILQRVMSALTDAVSNGFIQMGRRKTETNIGIPEYVAVALGIQRTDESKLFKEFFVRLLPHGRNLANETRSLLEETPTSTKQNDAHQTISDANSISLFMGNVPLTVNAKQFAEFLESTLSCSVQRLVLEEGIWSRKPARSAHVKLSSSEEGDEVLREIKSRPNGLVYCGQCIYAVADYAPRNAANNTISNMSYIKDEIDKTPSLMGFVLDHSMPNLGSIDNQFINDFGTTVSLDSDIVRNDHRSVNDSGSFASPNTDDIAKDQFKG